MFKKIYAFIFLFTFLVSFGVAAIDFTGTYQGGKCTRNEACVDGDSGDGLLSNFLKSINVKNEDRILMLVEHEIKKKTVRIFFPDFDYWFNDMKLEGDKFSGTDDKSGNTEITGSFIGPVLKVTMVRFPGQNNSQTFYYKGTLGKNDQILRTKIIEIEAKDLNIKKLTDEKKKLQSELNKSKKTVENKIKEIKELEIQISNLNKKIDKTISDNKEKIKGIKKNHANEIAKLEKEHKIAKDNLTEQLQKCATKPIRINVTFIELRGTVIDDSNLYTAPSDQSKKVETLAVGTKVENFKLVGSNKDWALVVTEDGLIGYMSAENIGDDANGDSPPPPPGPDKITITSPSWDSGFKGERMTVEPGFISILGNLNIESGVLEIQLNDSVCDPPDNNGRFECFYIIESGDTNISLKVIDRNNDIHELNFIIKGN